MCQGYPKGKQECVRAPQATCTHSLSWISPSPQQSSGLSCNFKAVSFTAAQGAWVSNWLLTGPIIPHVTPCSVLSLDTSVLVSVLSYSILTAHLFYWILFQLIFFFHLRLCLAYIILCCVTLSQAILAHFALTASRFCSQIPTNCRNQTWLRTMNVN